jgi:hypothetical protein
MLVFAALMILVRGPKPFPAVAFAFEVTDAIFIFSYMLS